MDAIDLFAIRFRGRSIRGFDFFHMDSGNRSLALWLARLAFW